MKVLFVTREYPPFDVGGIAVHTFNLVKNISRLGVSCKVLSFGNENFSSEDVTFVNPSSSIIERSNVSLALNAKIPVDIVRFSGIANRMLKKEQFDVVHVEEPYVGAFVSPSGQSGQSNHVPHHQLWRGESHDRSFDRWLWLEESLFLLFNGTFL